MIDIAKLKLKRQLDKDNKDKYHSHCKNLLFKSIEKRITTTMIGSLSAIEKELGDLWNHGNTPSNEDERYFKEQYDILRKRILDLGNSQIEYIKKELDNYDINSKTYTVSLPINPYLKEEGQ